MLFDIPKTAVFAEILVHSNIFGFPAANGAPKCKTVNFRCLPFKLKFKLLKDFLNTVVFSNTYWRLPLVKISAKLKNVWESMSQKKN